jgi:hypothetical protein
VAVHEDDLLVDHGVGDRHGLLRSQASSPTSSLSFSPSTPPLALMSAIAISAPLRIWSPAEAYWPRHRAGNRHQVIGVGVAAQMPAG